MSRAADSPSDEVLADVQGDAQGDATRAEGRADDSNACANNNEQLQGLRGAAGGSKRSSLNDVVALTAAEGAGVEGMAAGLKGDQEEEAKGQGEAGDKNSAYDAVLVIDANSTGNVARYINHSCDGGNLAIQPVLTGKCRNVFFYYISFFAASNIPRGTELTYNYNTKYKGMSCRCNAPGCRGQMS
eukprot:gene13695-19587_t